jgi:hypothetical protein
LQEELIGDAFAKREEVVLAEEWENERQPTAVA